MRAGEIVGLYGLMGAGRTELFESLLGVHPDAAGEVRLNGRDLRALDVSDRVEAGLAMVPEDRQAAGLVPTLTVCENMTLSSLARLAPRGYLSPAVEARSRGAYARRRCASRHPRCDAPVSALSGGNQQKVVLARAVMSRPRVLLIDEPTRGVDVAAKFEILESMRRLAAKGLAIVFATSDLAEVLAVATSVLVMARGRISRRAAGDRRDGRRARGGGVRGAGERQRSRRWPLARSASRCSRSSAAPRRHRPGRAVVAFSLLSPEFLTTGNLTILVKHVAINAILAIGMTFVILSGGIDLSVGSIAGLSGMIAGGLVSHGLVLPPLGGVVYLHTWLVVAIALAAGMVLGGVNGLLVARLSVPPFIATLGVLYVARGAALLLSDGATFPNLAGAPTLGNTGLPCLGAGTLLGLPMPIWLMAALAAAAMFVATRTPFGRQSMPSAATSGRRCSPACAFRA